MSIVGAIVLRWFVEKKKKERFGSTGGVELAHEKELKAGFC